MTLFEYFSKYSIIKAEFARKLGIAESTLFKYINQERDPRLHIAIRIFTLTEGKVAYVDLLREPQDADIEGVSSVDSDEIDIDLL